MDWQRQNFKKGATEPAPSSLNPKISQGASQMHSKIAAPTHSMGGLVPGNPPMPHMANGGLVAGLAAGLGAAYLYNKNKDAKKEVGVDEKTGQKTVGESEMRSAESDTDKTRVIAEGMKPKSVDDGMDVPHSSPDARADSQPSGTFSKATEWKPSGGDASPSTSSSSSSAKKARPVKPAPKAAPEYSGDAVNVSSGASGFDAAPKAEAKSDDDPQYGKSKTLKRIVKAAVGTATNSGSYDPFKSPLNKR
jgi:hypothetical protein